MDQDQLFTPCGIFPNLINAKGSKTFIFVPELHISMTLMDFLAEEKLNNENIYGNVSKLINKKDKIEVHTLPPNPSFKFMFYLLSLGLCYHLSCLVNICDFLLIWPFCASVGKVMISHG